MARVDATAVRLVCQTSLENEQINAFIADASLWVDENLSGQSLSTALLAAIEKYLACYFIGLRDPRLKSKKRDTIMDTFVRDGDKDPYLQAAIRLDPTGAVEEAFTEVAAFSFRVGAGYDDERSLPVNGA